MRERDVLRIRADAGAAVLAGAVTVFIVLAILVSTDPRLRLDLAVLEIVKASAEPDLIALAEGPLDTVAQPGVVLVVAGIVAVVLAVRRWWVALVILAGGLALTGWLGTELKELFGRARPTYNLDEASNPAFPSGHARFSFFWTWLAVAVAANVRLLASVRRALIAMGLAVTAVTGLARVYIGAHWLTDVVAGWVLSAAMFAAVTVLAVGVARWWTTRRGRGRGERRTGRRPSRGRDARDTPQVSTLSGPRLWWCPLRFLSGRTRSWACARTGRRGRRSDGRRPAARSGG